MRSVDTGYKQPKGNPAQVGKYLVYGSSRPAVRTEKFEAWYWIDIPGIPPTRVEGEKQFGTGTYETIGLAEIAGVHWGIERAKTFPQE
ncbi:hypothetical protein F506_17830 [Herbaspirillum hiltneri N3]|uniref:Uncharacterized protein n=1 Tax=Herbaspirillum hiltneri N3 TaxID=1262470 RepID=A0ABN4I1A2_9BURK|nr:hypothetical protein [Herbaspirillum hiltneri]AKZ64277.1 hypothetical protein F506_17830 [Herbaspirillum hiltneri N3]